MYHLGTLEKILLWFLSLQMSFASAFISWAV